MQTIRSLLPSDLVARYREYVTTEAALQPPPPAPIDGCERCQGLGWLSAGLQHTPAGYRTTRRKCPDCDTACAQLGPSLRWDSPVAYRLDDIPARTPHGKALRLWLASESRPFLVVSGPNGTGKTYTAITVGRELARRGLTVEYWTAPGLLKDLRATFRHDDRSTDAVLYHAQADDALVLDDLGAEQRTDYADDALLSLIDSRYEARRLTVVTTNELQHGDNDRLWSRLLDRNLSRVILLRGTNWRSTPR